MQDSLHNDYGLNSCELAHVTDARLNGVVERLDALDKRLDARTIAYPAPGTMLSQINWDNAITADQQTRTIVTILSSHIDVLYARLSELERHIPGDAVTVELEP